MSNILNISYIDTLILANDIDQNDILKHRIDILEKASRYISNGSPNTTFEIDNYVFTIIPTEHNTYTIKASKHQ